MSNINSMAEEWDSYFCNDGLSSTSEFDKLCAIGDRLTKTMTERFDAVFCGRITTDAHTENFITTPCIPRTSSVNGWKTGRSLCPSLRKSNAPHQILIAWF